MTPILEPSPNLPLEKRVEELQILMEQEQAEAERYSMFNQYPDYLEHHVMQMHYERELKQSIQEVLRLRGKR